MDRAVPTEELSARRFFAAQLPESPGELELDSVAIGHMRVLRLAVDAELALFDGRGQTVRAVLRDLKRGRVQTLSTPSRVEPPPFVGLLLCVPKSHKVDDIVRMTTEIGVSALVLAISERSTGRSRDDRDEHKRERLERVAIEAVRQSEQAYVPRITMPQPLSQTLAALQEGPARLALLERAEGGFSPPVGAFGLWLAVGPEGGFSARDREELRGAGFVGVGLGPSILRTETAAVVGVGLAMDWLFRSRRP